MKKSLLYILFLFLGLSLQAQESVFGVKGGFNFSGISSKDYSTKMRFSVNFGAKYNIYLKDKMGIQPEMYASWQGAKFSLDSGDTKVNLTYLNIPVLYKYFFRPNVMAYAGPQMGILLSGKEKTDGEKQFAKHQFRTLDFAFVLGGEFLVKQDISIELRYNIGISKLLDNPFVSDRMRNNVLQLGGSYYF